MQTHACFTIACELWTRVLQYYSMTNQTENYAFQKKQAILLTHIFKCAATLFILFTFICITGCTNVSLLDAQHSFQQGNLGTAQSKIDTYANSNTTGKDAVIAWLNKGSIDRSLGNYAQSNQSFAIAEQQIKFWDEQPEFKISNESLSLVTNLNTLPYRGYHYDRIMLNTYKALNYLQLGNKESARIELRRAYNHQHDAVAHNAKRIENARETVQKQLHNHRNKQTNIDIQRTIRNLNINKQINNLYKDLNNYQTYTNYINPFTELLQALFYMHTGNDDADFSRAEKSLERIINMQPNNPYIKKDRQTLKRIRAGAPSSPLTYIIFETGIAPTRNEIRFDLPMFLFNNEVEYIGMTFPNLVMHNNFIKTLHITTAGNQINTKLISNMDAIVAQEFMNDLPLVIAKTIANTAAKTSAAWGIKKSTKKNSDLRLFTVISSTIYQLVANQADLRTWATLPKQFQYANIQTPANQTLTLTLSQTNEKHTIKLQPALINVIYVKSIAPNIPVQISQFTF